MTDTLRQNICIKDQYGEEAKPKHAISAIYMRVNIAIGVIVVVMYHSNEWSQNYFKDQGKGASRTQHHTPKHNFKWVMSRNALKRDAKSLMSEHMFRRFV